MSPHRDTFEERFQMFLESESLVSPGDAVALALSGGPDSMVMLHLFLAVQNAWKLSLSVVHVNHSLRGDESDSDEAFVRDIAREYHLPLHTERVDTKHHQHLHKLSKQESARILRYEVFERARASLGASLVATAHTATDNAETVLLNILRGTGVRGLAGIPLRRGAQGIIRPMLFALREEVERFAEEKRILYRIDSSNALVSSTRNLLRHEIIPLLSEQINADVTGALLRVSHTMRHLVERLDQEVASGADDIVRKDTKGRVVLALENLELAPPFLHDEYLLRALREASAPVSSEKLLQLRDLWNGQSGRRLDLSRTTVAVKRGREILLGPPESPVEFAHSVELGSEYAFHTFSFSAKPLAERPGSLPRSGDHAIIDGSALGRSLTIRSWHPGDRFTPLGMRGHKKLSDFFTDQKISQERRHEFPVFESDGSIVWVCGLRIDDRAKVTPSTTRWVELSFHYHA